MFFSPTTYVHIEFVQLLKFKVDTMTMCMFQDELNTWEIQNMVVILGPWLLMQTILYNYIGPTKK
jgi:hypothetical protein